jgi:hypothetical protein
MLPIGQEAIAQHEISRSVYTDFADSAIGPLQTLTDTPNDLYEPMEGQTSLATNAWPPQSETQNPLRSNVSPNQPQLELDNGEQQHLH